MVSRNTIIHIIYLTPKFFIKEPSNNLTCAIAHTIFLSAANQLVVMLGNISKQKAKEGETKSAASKTKETFQMNQEATGSIKDCQTGNWQSKRY